MNKSNDVSADKAHSNTADRRLICCCYHSEKVGHTTLSLYSLGETESNFFSEFCQFSLGYKGRVHNPPSRLAPKGVPEADSVKI